MAESERFELSVQYHRTHAFQACSFNHSDNSPLCSQKEAIQFLLALAARNDIKYSTHAQAMSSTFSKKQKIPRRETSRRPPSQHINRVSEKLINCQHYPEGAEGSVYAQAKLPAAMGLHILTGTRQPKLRINLPARQIHRKDAIDDI